MTNAPLICDTDRSLSLDIATAVSSARPSQPPLGPGPARRAPGIRFGDADSAFSGFWLPPTPHAAGVALRHFLLFARSSLVSCSCSRVRRDSITCIYCTITSMLAPDRGHNSACRTHVCCMSAHHSAISGPLDPRFRDSSSPLPSVPFSHTVILYVNAYTVLNWCGR